MKEQELLFLGLLQDGPKHGYQLKKLMREVSSTFAGFKTDSIYYPLKKMLKAGLVIQKEAREGNRPKKYVYSITSKGRDEFRQLLRKNILTIERPYFSIDLSLYFLDSIPLELRKRYLKIRLRLLKKLKNALEDLKKKTFRLKSSSNLITILEHSQRLLDTEIGFIEHMAA